MSIDEEGLIPFLLRNLLGKSWATSIGGLLVGVPILIPEVSKMFDGDDSTLPNWSFVVSGVGAAVLGRVARTDWVTSEQVKGTNHPPGDTTPGKPS